MEKNTLKTISNFIPRGLFKEKIKSIWFNFLSDKFTKFSLIKTENRKVQYRTKYKELSIITNEPLYYEISHLDFYQHLYKIQPNDFVLDAGANIGHFSILFSKLATSSGRVFAFEPDKFNIEKLTNNLKLNFDNFENIKIFDQLLWNENNLVDFYEAGTVGSSAIWKPNSEKLIKKQAITIDSWVKDNNITKLDFIKMDIEGAEIEALEGCVETIKTLQPNFAIASYHIVDGQPTHIDLDDFFKSINYPSKTIKFDKNEIITFAGKNI
jgi:FkbM family methyltransferase